MNKYACAIGSLIISALEKEHYDPDLIVYICMETKHGFFRVEVGDHEITIRNEDSDDWKQLYIAYGDIQDPSHNPEALVAEVMETIEDGLPWE